VLLWIVGIVSELFSLAGAFKRRADSSDNISSNSQGIRRTLVQNTGIYSVLSQIQVLHIYLYRMLNINSSIGNPLEGARNVL
jgi:hypothetical protein